MRRQHEDVRNRPQGSFIDVFPRARPGGGLIGNCFLASPFATATGAGLEVVQQGLLRERLVFWGGVKLQECSPDPFPENPIFSDPLR